jgi:hypothetical protein
MISRNRTDDYLQGGRGPLLEHRTDAADGESDTSFSATDPAATSTTPSTDTIKPRKFE